MGPQNQEVANAEPSALSRALMFEELGCIYGCVSLGLVKKRFRVAKGRDAWLLFV